MLLPLGALFLVPPLLQLSLLLILAQSSVFRRRSMQLFHCFAVPLLLTFLAVLAAVLGIVSTSHHTESDRVVRLLLDLTLGAAIIQIQCLLSTSPRSRWRASILAPSVLIMCSMVLAFIPSQRLSSTIIRLVFLLVTFPCTIIFLLYRMPTNDWDRGYTSPSSRNTRRQHHDIRLTDLSPSPTSSSFSRPSCDKQEKRSLSLSYDAPMLAANSFYLPPPPPPTPTTDSRVPRPRSNARSCRDPTISWFSAHSDIDVESGVTRGIGRGTCRRLRNLTVERMHGCMTSLLGMFSGLTIGHERRTLDCTTRVRMLFATFVGQVLLSASATVQLAGLVLAKPYHAESTTSSFAQSLNVPELPSKLWMSHTLAVLRVAQAVFTVLAMLCILLAYSAYTVAQMRSSHRPLSIQVTTTRTITSAAPPDFDASLTSSVPTSPPPAYSSPVRRSSDYCRSPASPTPTHTYIRPPQRTRNHRSHTVPVLTHTPAQRPVKVELVGDEIVTPSPYSRFLDSAAFLQEGTQARLSPTPERRATIVHMPHHQSHEPLVACEVDEPAPLPLSPHSEPVKKKCSLGSFKSKRRSTRDSLVERTRKASFASFIDALHASQCESKTQNTLQPSTMFHSPSCFSRLSLSSCVSRISRSSKLASGYPSSPPSGCGKADEAAQALQELFDPSDPFAMAPLPHLRQNFTKDTSADLYRSALEEEGSSSSCESYETARSSVKPPTKVFHPPRKRGMHAWGRLPLLYSSSSKDINPLGKGSRKRGEMQRKLDHHAESMEDSARLAAKLLIRMGEPGEEHADFRAL